MNLSTIVSRLDETLDNAAYSDVDASANGLQVGPADRDIDHIAFAVDAATATIEAAADAGADLLVTHHGLSWGGIERVTGRQYDRISALIDHDIALYVSHLPLDGHQTHGNAAGLAALIGLIATEPFGSLGSLTIGQQGRVDGAMTIDELGELLSAELDREKPVRLLDFGARELDRVAIVTGSGVDWLDEAVAAGCDTLITGEGKQQVYHEAREAGINVVLAGHYATETFGVRSLQSLVDDWGVKTSYHSHPTGL